MATASKIYLEHYGVSLPGVRPEEHVPLSATEGLMTARLRDGIDALARNPKWSNPALRAAATNLFHLTVEAPNQPVQDTPFHAYQITEELRTGGLSQLRANGGDRLMEIIDTTTKLGEFVTLSSLMFVRRQREGLARVIGQNSHNLPQDPHERDVFQSSLPGGIIDIQPK